LHTIALLTKRISGRLVPAGLLLSALAPALCHAATPQCVNGQYSSFSQGNYTIQNDEWNLSALNGEPGTEEVCPGSASTGSWSATWNWPVGSGALKAYPDIISGGNSFGNWNYNTNGFPVRVSANAPLPTSVTYNMVGNNQFDTAYDLFFSPSANPSRPSAELMVWLSEVGNQPAGSKVATAVSITGEPGTWDVWQGNVGWLVWTFVSTTQMMSFSSNLQPFIHYVANTKGWLQASWYEINTEFGTEITYSHGSSGGINVTSFSATAQATGTNGALK
jgi:xyloglucan-specific endo-beta-1,4-glucanase